RMVERLGQVEEQTAGVVEVQLALGSFGAVDRVELAKVHAEHAVFSVGLPGSERLLQELQVISGVCPGEARGGRPDAQMEGPPDRVPLVSQVDPRPGHGKAVGLVESAKAVLADLRYRHPEIDTAVSVREGRDGKFIVPGA